MSRQLRVQFPGAIYHVTSRGNRRQDIFLDDVDRDTFFGRIGDTVYKYAWEMFAAVLMTNHCHLFFRTPQPNLSRGMQFLLTFCPAEHELGLSRRDSAASLPRRSKATPADVQQQLSPPACNSACNFFTKLSRRRLSHA